MSLTYKIASTIVRLLGVKKIFLKNKEGMLAYGRKEKWHGSFCLDSRFFQGGKPSSHRYFLGFLLQLPGACQRDSI